MTASARGLRPTLTALELRCPPLPQTLLEAMALIEHPERLDARAVTKVVQRDPAIVARLLQLVNSAYYGLSRSISSVDRAVVALGPVTVAGLVVGTGMFRLRSTLAGPSTGCFTRLVHHSLATAFLSRHLAERVGITSPAQRDASFTAGLLHDFGKIVLVYNFPEQATAFYETHWTDSASSPDAACRLEQERFGYDHTEVGEYAARKLGFPEVIIEVIRFHHAPERTRADGETVRLLRTTAAANLAAHALGYGLGPTPAWSACLHHPIWTRFLQEEAPPETGSPALFAELRAQRDPLERCIRSFSGASRAA